MALLLCIAAGITVQQLTPAPAYTVSAFAAARDLPAGKTLGPDDLTVLDVPRGLVPAGSYGSNDSPRGKQLAVALRKGQLLSDAQLLGPGLLAGSPPGSAAVPLRMADPASIQLLSPGQLVNVVMTTGDGFDQPAASQVLAAAVPVLWTSGHGGEAGQWLAAGETEGLMVVAADADQARPSRRRFHPREAVLRPCGGRTGLAGSQQAGPAGATVRRAGTPGAQRRARP